MKNAAANPTKFKRGLSKMRRESAAGRYDSALAVVDDLLSSWRDNPRLLVLRAELIQMMDESAPPLAEAKECLDRAVQLDEDAVDALVEKGHFELSVEDDAAASAKSFDRAAAIAKRLLEESLIGKAAALTELGRRDEAFRCLAEASWLQQGNGKKQSRANGGAILDRWHALYSAE